ncbi:cyclase family protein [Rhizobium altiplani]|uniref:cyclase family protein n=1 Tax=Rhizobium altiplani TaxID=1864509 RepID=UPI00315A362E
MYREVISSADFVDLTHAFGPGQPRFSSFPDEERRLVMDFDRGDIAQVHRYSFVGQWGTHVDPPVHFVKGGRTIDELPVSEMLLPLVVIDISERVGRDPDATPTVEDLTEWEERHGQIPSGCFVALRTDWHTSTDRQDDRRANINGVLRLHSQEIRGCGRYSGIQDAP